MKRLFNKNKQKLRRVRQQRVRAKIFGTGSVPRLSVFRSLRGISAQLVDDQAGRTVVAVRSGELEKQKLEGKSAKVAAAYLVGKKLAEFAKAKGVGQVVFDRAGYKYHGRVAALAEGARDGGLTL